MSDPLDAGHAAEARVRNAARAQRVIEGVAVAVALLILGGVAVLNRFSLLDSENEASRTFAAFKKDNDERFSQEDRELEANRAEVQRLREMLLANGLNPGPEFEPTPSPTTTTTTTPRRSTTTSPRTSLRAPETTTTPSTTSAPPTSPASTTTTTAQRAPPVTVPAPVCRVLRSC